MKAPCLLHFCISIPLVFRSPSSNMPAAGGRGELHHGSMASSRGFAKDHCTTAAMIHLMSYIEMWHMRSHMRVRAPEKGRQRSGISDERTWRGQGSSENSRGIEWEAVTISVCGHGKAVTVAWLIWVAVGEESLRTRTFSCLPGARLPDL